MPRRSAASLAIVTPIINRRPPPPDDLTEPQAVEWRRIVARMPGDWFPAETWPILAALCRHIVQARMLADLVNQFRPAWAAEEGGLERLDRLLKMLDREHHAICRMSTKLRLTNQSRYDAQKALTATRNARPENPPWEFIS
jgi:hypothetical protein